MTNDTPGTLVNQWTSTKVAKGTTVVVLVDLASERPSNELTLQASNDPFRAMGRMSNQSMSRKL